MATVTGQTDSHNDSLAKLHVVHHDIDVLTRAGDVQADIADEVSAQLERTGLADLEANSRIGHTDLEFSRAAGKTPGRRRRKPARLANDADRAPVDHGARDCRRSA